MLLRALFLRPLRRSPVRFAATVIGVASGVALFVSTLASSRAAVASLAQGVLEISGDARLEATSPGGIDESALAALRPLAGRARLLPVVEEIVLCMPERETARLLGIDPLIDDAARRFLARALDTDGSDAGDDGPWMRTLRGEGAWVARDWAALRRWTVGSRIDVTIGAKPHALEILGLFDVPESAPAWERAIVVDVALAQELCDRVGRLDRIEIVPRHDEALDSLAVDARRMLPPIVTVAEPARRGRQTSAMVRSLEFNLTALAGISLFVGGVLVATTLASSVIERRATIALLRSLGAGRVQIARAIVIEAVAIGALGGALGFGLGYAASGAVLEGVRATYSTVVHGAPATPIRFDLGYAWLALALGIGVSALAAVAPLVEAARTPPIQAWRETASAPASRRRRALAIGAAFACASFAAVGTNLPAVDGLPIPALAGILCVLCALCALGGPSIDALTALGRRVRADRPLLLPVALAAAALAVGRKRAAFASSAVGVAVALSIAIATLVHSFRGTMIDWTETSLRADLSVRPFGPIGGLAVGRLDPAIVSVAEREFGPGVVDPLYAADAYVGDQRITFAGAAFDVLAAHGGVPCRDGRASSEVFAAAHASGRALVNEAFAHRFGVGEGDTITIEARGGEQTRTIEGVYYDYGDSQGWVIVDRREFLATHAGEGPRDVALFLPEELSASDAEARMRSALADAYQVEILDNSTLKARILEVFDRTFAITVTMETVAAAVAVIAVLSVLFALVWERRSDLALFASLGASRETVRAVVCAEAAALGLVGALGGAATGLVMGVVLVRVVNLQSFGWTVHLSQPWVSVIVMVAGVCVACLLAGLWPASWVARRRLAEGLRVED